MTCAAEVPFQAPCIQAMHSACDNDLTIRNFKARSSCVERASLPSHTHDVHIHTRGYVSVAWVLP